MDDTRRRARLLRRRDAIAALGATGVGVGVGAGILGVRALWRGPGATASSLWAAIAAREARAAGSCSPTPQQTEGPYYLDDEPSRRDITEGRPGVPLAVILKVVDAATCKAVAGAEVEIWHCDAGGDYSGFGSGAWSDSFLRGRQTATARGRVHFETIYPGWYRGRTTHIHCKVHLGGEEVHTGQLYFADAVSDAVYAKAPYSNRGARDQTNATDRLFDARTVMKLRSRNYGYAARRVIAIATT